MDRTDLVQLLVLESLISVVIAIVLAVAALTVIYSPVRRRRRHHHTKAARRNRRQLVVPAHPAPPVAPAKDFASPLSRRISE